MKKKTLKQLKNKLWQLCKEITRKKYPPICYTCDKRLTSKNDMHTGHGKAKSILPLKYQYDIRGLRIQCYACNIHHGGMTDIFITKLEREKEGLKFLKEVCVKTKEGWKVKHIEPMTGSEAYKFIEEKIEEYKKIL